ncbi:inosine-5'-monophosphate dehydrogenase [Halalkalicoccus paucihalophilus]|jgi:CBS domain-containing protein|uniref:Inosine-5'-monophosphate dehydrogenase n=1 Tax=Halalkalicoccus paucihalophilus TaxID=1008153 RepID=A0A151ABV9_9EURY|nr:CBS domain-containing protein [Halalkalicoccus paucihalophilus]KYH25074.1 inosine-5'-monophosphate dehydrogenase [Halalkalicoccus paucihalophilus]
MIELAVEAVLTRSVPTLIPSTPVVEAAELLRDPGVSALIVLDDDAIAGIVTESDFVAYVAETASTSRIDSIMSAPVVTVTPETSITTAATLMRERGVRHLPVVNTDDTYCGLVSATTLALYLSPHSLEIDWDSEPLELDASGESSREFDG